MLFLRKIAHIFCWTIGNILFRFLFHFEIKGKEGLKDLKGPLIVVFNHSSYLDAFFVITALPPNSKVTPVQFAVWHKYYQKFRPLLAIAGSFPVEKGVGLGKTLKRGLEILNKGGVVGIFPEGKRRHLGRPRKGRRGPAFLALKTNSPILPIYIEGALGLKSSDFFSRKRKVKVKIGEVFSLSYQPISTPSDLDAPANFIRDKIYQLKEK